MDGVAKRKRSELSAWPTVASRMWLILECASSLVSCESVRGCLVLQISPQMWLKLPQGSRRFPRHPERASAGSGLGFQVPTPERDSPVNNQLNSLCYHLVMLPRRVLYEATDDSEDCSRIKGRIHSGPTNGRTMN